MANDIAILKQAITVLQQALVELRKIRGPRCDFSPEQASKLMGHKK